MAFTLPLLLSKLKPYTQFIWSSSQQCTLSNTCNWEDSQIFRCSTLHVSISTCILKHYRLLIYWITMCNFKLYKWEWNNELGSQQNWQPGQTSNMIKGGRTTHSCLLLTLFGEKMQIPLKCLVLDIVRSWRIEPFTINTNRCDWEI